MPQACTFTRTDPGPGSGTGRSTISKDPFGRGTCTTRMVAMGSSSSYIRQAVARRRSVYQRTLCRRVDVSTLRESSWRRTGGLTLMAAWLPVAHYLRKPPVADEVAEEGGPAMRAMVLKAPKSVLQGAEVATPR